MPITHNKNLNPSNLLINCKSAKSVSQIFSRKGECTFHFSNFLIIGLRNYSANSLLEVILFVTAKLTSFKNSIS